MQRHICPGSNRIIELPFFGSIVMSAKQRTPQGILLHGRWPVEPKPCVLSITSRIDRKLPTNVVVE
jgi:hypothetical protein